jgi:4-amino-4-deoxy-L-arabinose transferase-like glycosyltransferase
VKADAGLRGLLNRLRAGAEEGEEEGQPFGGLIGSLPNALILGAVTLLALVARLHDFAVAPGLTDAPDEYSFTWAGMQILRGHQPAGATAGVAAYSGGHDVSLFGLTFHLVTPWLDHPPLFTLLPGAAELAAGFRRFGEISPSVMRVPSILLGVATVVLGYQLARRLLPPTGAVLAAFLLAVEPGLVLLSRLAVAEAALAPLLLLAVLLATPAVSDSTHQGSAGAGPAVDQAPTGPTLALLLAVCLVSPLILLSGVVVPVTALALLLSRGIRREAWLAAAAGAAGVGLYALYGLVLDGGTFVRVFQQELAGAGGVLTPIRFVTTSIGPTRSFLDAWYLFSWAALAYLAGNAKRRHRYRPLLWPVAVYLVMVTPFLPSATLAQSGWTRLPILPLLLLGGAAALYAAVREGQLLVPALGLMSAGVWSLQWLFRAPFRPGALTLLVLFAVGAVPMAVTEVRSKGRARDAALGIWSMVALLVLAGDTVLTWNLAGLLGTPGVSAG